MTQTLERTGEFRVPNPGEWHECPGYAPAIQGAGMGCTRSAWILRPVEPVGGEGEKVRYFKYIGVHPRYKLVELRPGDSAAWLHWSNGEVTNEGPHWNEEYIVETPQAFQRIDEAEAKELIRQLQPLSPPASSKPDLQEEIERLKRTIAEDDAKIARLEQQLSLAGECYRMTREMLEETWKQFNIARNKS
jgi:hypothetical protein